MLEYVGPNAIAEGIMRVVQSFHYSLIVARLMGDKMQRGRRETYGQRRI